MDKTPSGYFVSSTSAAASASSPNVPSLALGASTSPAPISRNSGRIEASEWQLIRSDQARLENLQRRSRDLSTLDSISSTSKAPRNAALDEIREEIEQICASWTRSPRFEALLRRCEKRPLALALLNRIFQSRAFAAMHQTCPDLPRELLNSLASIYRRHHSEISALDHTRSAKAKNMCDISLFCVCRLFENLDASAISVDMLTDLADLARRSVSIANTSFRLAVRGMELSKFVSVRLRSVLARTDLEKSTAALNDAKKDLEQCFRYGLRLMYIPRKKRPFEAAQEMLLASQWLTIPWTGSELISSSGVSTSTSTTQTLTKPTLTQSGGSSHRSGPLCELQRRIAKVLRPHQWLLEPLPSRKIVEMQVKDLGWSQMESRTASWRRNTLRTYHHYRPGLDLVQGQAGLHALWLRVVANYDLVSEAAFSKINPCSSETHPPNCHAAQTSRRAERLVSLAMHSTGNSNNKAVATYGSAIGDIAKSVSHLSTAASTVAPTDQTAIDAFSCTTQAVLAFGAILLTYSGYPQKTSDKTLEDALEREGNSEACLLLHRAMPNLIKASSNPQDCLLPARCLLIAFTEQHLGEHAAMTNARTAIIDHASHLMHLFGSICSVSDDAQFKEKCFAIWTFTIASISPTLLEDLDVWDLCTAPVLNAANATMFFRNSSQNQSWMAEFLFNANPSERPMNEQSNKYFSRACALNVRNLAKPVEVTLVFRSEELMKTIWTHRLELCVQAFIWQKEINIGPSAQHLVRELMVTKYSSQALIAMKREPKLLRLLELNEIQEIARKLGCGSDAQFIWKKAREVAPGKAVLAANLQDSVELLETCFPESKRERSLQPLASRAVRDSTFVDQVRKAPRLLVSILRYNALRNISPGQKVRLLRLAVVGIRSWNAKMASIVFDDIGTLAQQERLFDAGLTLIIDNPAFVKSFFKILFAETLDSTLRAALFDTEGEMLDELIVLTQRKATSNRLVSRIMAETKSGDPIDLIDSQESTSSLHHGPAFADANKDNYLFRYPPDGGHRVTYVGDTELDIVKTKNRHFNDALVQFYFLWCKREKYKSYYETFQESIFVFDSLFFSKMMAKFYDKKTRNTDEVYAEVASWYQNEELFAKDMWVIPIVYEMHWSLLLVCDVQTDNPILVHLDSIGSHESVDIERICRAFWRRRAEATYRPSQTPPSSPQLVRVQPPRQENDYDCGPFICKYYDQILRELFVTKRLQLGDMVACIDKVIQPRWFAKSAATRKEERISKPESNTSMKEGAPSVVTRDSAKAKHFGKNPVGGEIRTQLLRLIEEKSMEASQNNSHGSVSSTSVGQEGGESLGHSSVRSTSNFDFDPRAYIKLSTLLFESTQDSNIRKQIWDCIYSIESKRHRKDGGFAEALVRAYHRYLPGSSELAPEVSILIEFVDPDRFNELLLVAIWPLLKACSMRSTEERICSAIIKYIERNLHPGSGYELPHGSEAEWFFKLASVRVETLLWQRFQNLQKSMKRSVALKNSAPARPTGDTNALTFVQAGATSQHSKHNIPRSKLQTLMRTDDDGNDGDHGGVCSTSNHQDNTMHPSNIAKEILIESRDKPRKSGSSDNVSIKEVNEKDSTSVFDRGNDLTLEEQIKKGTNHPLDDLVDSQESSLDEDPSSHANEDNAVVEILDFDGDSHDDDLVLGIDIRKQPQSSEKRKADVQENETKPSSLVALSGRKRLTAKPLSPMIAKRKRTIVHNSADLESTEGPEDYPIDPSDLVQVRFALDQIVGQPERLCVYKDRFLSAAQSLWDQLEEERNTFF